MKIKNVKLKSLSVYPHKLHIIPGEVMRIHIYQPNTVALINDCFANGSDFIAPLNISCENEKMGVHVKLIDIERFYPDGKMDIKIKGEHLVKIQKINHGSPKFEQASVKKYNGKISTTHLVEISNLHQAISKNKLITSKLKQNPNYIFDIANQLELPKSVKKRLLNNCLNSENQSKILLNELRLLHLTTKLQEVAGFRCYLN